jgi:hypothetical protein
LPNHSSFAKETETARSNEVKGIQRRSSDAYRGRQLLNADTIREMHAAFRAGGRAAIDKVMKNQPAIFLKPIRHLRGLAGGMRLRRAGIFCPFSGKRCVGQFLRSA